MATHVVLVHPEIHWNTGNAGRTCLATGATLHLVAPLGFSLDERQVKRAGLDYWEHVDLRVWPNWDAFEAVLPSLGTAYFFATQTTHTFWATDFGSNDDVVLIFGSEGKGLPVAIIEKYRAQLLQIPMASSQVRSLNLSTCVAIALYEVLRQRHVAVG